MIPNRNDTISSAFSLMMMSMLFQRERRGKKRAGITKNKGQKRSMVRAKLAKESRRRNRVR